ncbi:MAG: glycosyltransferase family A protein [Bacteroidota bacterium]
MKESVSAPLLSVIIPTRHRLDLLAECLDCLRPQVQGLTVDELEVIVSDDGVAPTAQRMISEQYPWVRWIKGPEKGPASNRNHGAGFARAPLLAFVDDDCLPASGWAAAYLQAAEAFPGYQVFEGKTVADRPQMRFDEVSPVNETGGNLWTCNLMVRAEYFKAIGGFCEDFRFELEDLEFKTRVEKDQQPLCFVAEARVCHPWRKVVKRDTIAVDSIMTFLKHHPDHKQYYSLTTRLKIILPRFFLLVPEAFRFRFRGIHYVVPHLLYELRSAFVIAYRLSK